MAGYGSKNDTIELNAKRKEMHDKQVEKLNELAKVRATDMYYSFEKSLKNEDCKGLSHAESLVLASYTGALFTASTVYGFYNSLKKMGANFDKLYTEQQIEDEMINALKNYCKNIRKTYRENNKNEQ